MYSPITGSPKVKLIGAISSETIISLYQTKHNINVKNYFDQLTSVCIYQCEETGYQFYYPFSLEGDGSFYEKLQSVSSTGYYMDWRWEHEQAFSLITPNSNVLEIGSGKGVFLEKLKVKNVNAEGIEHNEGAIKICLSKNLNVHGSSIIELLPAKAGTFDFICMFQTLEHVSDVRGFLNSLLQLLKPNGRLIFSVPNMDSFIGQLNDDCFNMPPHHMGLWNENSIINLQKAFPLKLKGIYTENLQTYHFGPYTRVILKKINLNNSSLLNKVLIKILQLPLCAIIFFLKRRIKGFAILADFEKVV